METIDETLEALAAGEIDVATARERLRGIDRIGEFARIDANYAARTGVPEIVWTAGKADDEAVAIARELVAETGLAILADAGPGLRDRLRDAPEPATVTLYDRSDTLVCRGPDRAEDGDRDDVRGGDGENGGTAEPAGAGAAGHGTVAVVTAGTSDVPVARRAEIIAREMGPAVETIYDVGVSSIDRLYAEAGTLAAADAVVVAAGREGALATVVAGMVEPPVIGLPVSTGTGIGGEGEAALYGMLQSCTFLTTVNVDAGFVAGAQAALIAR